MTEQKSDTSAKSIRSKKLKKDVPLPSDPLALGTEEQAAVFLGVTRRCLQAWRLTGNGPKYVRLSTRCIRYRRAELVSFSVNLIRSITSERKVAGR